MNELIDVEGQIKTVLEEIYSEWGESDKKWTQKIKELLGNLGVKLGYKICASGGNYDCGEWLYDLVWYKENDEGNLISVSLVVESEWKRRDIDIKYDFEKLLLANANLRLMICQAKYNKIQELKDYFNKAVQAYEILPLGSRFLVAILDDYDTGEFLYEVITKK